MRIITRTQAHYEVHDVEMGIVYRWCPERVAVECHCGEILTLTASTTACAACGADHSAITREVLDARPDDEVDHPWRFLNEYAPTRGA